METKSERVARGRPVGWDVPYAAMGGLVGFSSLLEGHLGQGAAGSGEIDPTIAGGSDKARTTLHFISLRFSIVTRINNHVDRIILERLTQRNVSVTTMRGMQRAARLSRVVEWRWRGIVSVLLRMFFFKKNCSFKTTKWPMKKCAVASCSLVAWLKSFKVLLSQNSAPRTHKRILPWLWRYNLCHVLNILNATVPV